MKNSIKPHPLMFFTFLKPVLVLALIPSVRALTQIIFLKTIGGFRFSEAAFFILLSLLAEFRRKSLSLSLFDGFFVLKKGLYFKSEIKVHTQKIASVYLRQNFIERIFSAKTVFINVFSDKKDGYTFKITLKENDAQKILEFIGIGQTLKEKRFSIFRIAIFAVASSSTLEGLLIFVPILKKSLNFFGIGLFDALFKGIGEPRTFTDRYIARAVNTVTLALVFIYLFGFLYQFLKNINFKLLKHQNFILLKSGFITKRESIINREDIRALVAEQTLFLRVFRRFVLKAAVGGYTGRFLANGIIAPFLTGQELKDFIKSLLEIDFNKKSELKKQEASWGLVSVVIVPLTIFVLLFLSFVYLFRVFYNFRRVIVLGFIITSVFLLFYAEVLIFGYKKGKITLNNNCLIIGTKLFKVRRLYIKSVNIGEIVLKENPFDRKRGSCKVSLSVFSKKPSTATVRWISKADAIEKLTKYV